MDWRKAHYVKVLCDEIFTENRFRNEVIWYYRRWSSAGDQFQRQHESLLIYSRSTKSIFNTLYEPYTEGTLRRWKGIKRRTTIGDDGKLIQIEDEDGPEGANMGDV
jgi:adenine specific DNA methylase Mod